MTLLKVIKYEVNNLNNLFLKDFLKFHVYKHQIKKENKILTQKNLNCSLLDSLKDFGMSALLKAPKETSNFSAA